MVKIKHGFQILLEYLRFSQNEHKMSTVMKFCKNKHLPILLFSMFFTIAPVMGFPPSNTTQFLQNCIRLLQNGEYEVLQQYFIKYYGKTSSSVQTNIPLKITNTTILNNKKLLSRFAKEIPIANIKLSILKHALKQDKVETKRNELHCYIGEQYAAQEEYKQSINYFYFCNSEKKYFFLGANYFELGNYSRAIWNYKKVEEIYPKNKNKKSASYQNELTMKKIAIIQLASIYSLEKKYRLSLQYAKKIPTGIQREIALHDAYMGLGRTSLAKRIAREIKKKYALTLAGKAFLSKYHNTR